MISISHAANISKCTPTTAMQVASKPMMSEIVHTDNSSTKDAGEFEDLYLHKVFLRGVIKDRNCVPIPNATINIWQEDEYGKDRYHKLSFSFTERYNLNREQYSKFLGVATATSNNNGDFTFITVLPASRAKKKMNAYINVSVKHFDFPSLETQLHMATNKPPKSGLSGYRNAEAERVYGMPTYDVEIILNGTNRYKSY